MPDGFQNNIDGLKTFAGDTSQNAVLSGKSSCGKSVFIIDLLTQEDCFYSHAIEEGLSELSSDLE